MRESVDSQASWVNGTEGSSVGMADMSASTSTSVHSSVSFFFAAGRMLSIDMRYEQAIVPDRPFRAARFHCYSSFFSDKGDSNLPLQWSTATRSLEPSRYECISLVARGRTASGGGLHPASGRRQTQMLHLILTGGLGMGTYSRDPRKQRRGKSFLPQDRS